MTHTRRAETVDLELVIDPESLPIQHGSKDDSATVHECASGRLVAHVHENEDSANARSLVDVDHVELGVGTLTNLSRSPVMSYIGREETYLAEPSGKTPTAPASWAPRRVTMLPP